MADHPPRKRQCRVAHIGHRRQNPHTRCHYPSSLQCMNRTPPFQMDASKFRNHRLGNPQNTAQLNIPSRSSRSSLPLHPYRTRQMKVSCPDVSRLFPRCLEVPNAHALCHENPGYDVGQGSKPASLSYVAQMACCQHANDYFAASATDAPVARPHSCDLRVRRPVALEHGHHNHSLHRSTTSRHPRCRNTRPALAPRDPRQRRRPRSPVPRPATHPALPLRPSSHRAGPQRCSGWRSESLAPEPGPRPRGAGRRPSPSPPPQVAWSDRFEARSRSSP